VQWPSFDSSTFVNKIKDKSEQQNCENAVDASAGRLRYCQPPSVQCSSERTEDLLIYEAVNTRPNCPNQSESKNEHQSDRRENCFRPPIGDAELCFALLAEDGAEHDDESFENQNQDKQRHCERLQMLPHFVLPFVFLLIINLINEHSIK